MLCMWMLWIIYYLQVHTSEESHVTLGMYFLTSDDVEFQMAKTSSMMKNAAQISFSR